MCFRFHNKIKSLTASRQQAGMTLVEVMMASALMTIVIAGVMSAHFLGLRESLLIQSKAGANDTTRKSVNQMLHDIRAAKGFAIGTVVGTNFTAITNGTLQGNGLQLFPCVIGTNQLVDTSQYILYYFDTSQAANNNGMFCTMSSTSGVPVVTLSNLINTLYFTSEDFMGNTQTVR
jgi:prepilin-type N-terminal cleavage/methylation domain-containing protein